MGPQPCIGPGPQKVLIRTSLLFYFKLIKNIRTIFDSGDDNPNTLLLS
jgi:hypothetical protein